MVALFTPWRTSTISHAPNKIVAPAQVAYKYGVVGQKVTAAQVRYKASQVAKNLTNGS